MRFPWRTSKEKSLFKVSARNFADFYCEYAQQHTLEFTLLEVEIANIFSTIGIYIDHKIWAGVVKVVKAIAEFLEAQGYWEELSHAYQDAIEAAERYFWSRGSDPEPAAWHDRIILRSDLGILHFRRGEYKKSKGLAQEALNQARRIKNQRLEALLSGLLGNIAITEGQYRLAEKLHNQCKDILEEFGDQEGVANALGRLALLATSQGDLDLAERYTRQRLSMFQQLVNFDKEADALRELGDLASARGNYEHAEEFYQNSLTLFRRTNNLEGIAWILDCRAKLLDKIGDPGGARDLYQEKLDFERQRGDQDSILQTLQSMASLELEQGVLDDAISYLQQTLSIAQSLGKLPDIAIALQGLAEVAQSQGDTEQALMLYEESLKIAYACGYSKLINIALFQLSLFARRSENYELAEKYLQEELALLEDVAFDVDKARTLKDLGDVTLILGKYGEAREFYIQAQDKYKSLNKFTEVGYCLAQLTLVELLDNNPGNAWDWLMQALEIHHHSEDVDLREMISDRLRDFRQIEEYREQAIRILTREKLLSSDGNPVDDL
jgi:tetratricopeptide (TPR) repeat protein